MNKINIHNQNGWVKTHGDVNYSLYLFHISYFISAMSPEAEKFNGWAAMLGFVAAFGAYATTGQIIPGIF